jgi:peptidoglycan/LPS O-acetylase OafA/YrhL
MQTHDQSLRLTGSEAGLEKPAEGLVNPDAAKIILSFEGLRGIMALIVCVGHLGLNTLAAKVGLQLRIELAVDVFFAMSGFVLTKAYYFERRTFTTLLWGRIARLYPLHALTAFWMLILALAAAQPQNWVLVLQNLLLLQNVGLPPNYWILNFPSWSISIEMVISLLFYFIARRNTTYLCICMILFGVFLGARELSSGLGPSYNELGAFNSGLLRGLAGFCIGCSAYMIVYAKAKSLERLGVLAPFLFLMIISFFFFPIWTGGIGLATGVAFESTLFVFLVVSASSDRRSLLALRPMVFLGNISYSIYMLHMPIYSTLAAFLRESEIRQSGKISVLLVILVISALCHRYFEIPVQQSISRATSRKTARSGVAFETESSA